MVLDELSDRYGHNLFTNLNTILAILQEKQFIPKTIEEQDIEENNFKGIKVNKLYTNTSKNSSNKFSVPNSIFNLPKEEKISLQNNMVPESNFKNESIANKLSEILFSTSNLNDESWEMSLSQINHLFEQILEFDLHPSFINSLRDRQSNFLHLVGRKKLEESIFYGIVKQKLIQTIDQLQTKIDSKREELEMPLFSETVEIEDERMSKKKKKYKNEKEMQKIWDEEKIKVIEEQNINLIEELSLIQQTQNVLDFDNHLNKIAQSNKNKMIFEIKQMNLKKNLTDVQLANKTILFKIDLKIKEEHLKAEELTWEELDLESQRQLKEIAGQTLGQNIKFSYILFELYK